MKFSTNNTFIKYSIIGVFNTFIGYGTTFFLFYVKVFPELANFLGYVLGFFVSYILNKKYNFKSTGSHKKDFPRFIASMMIAYMVNLLVFSLMYRFFEVNIYLAQVAAGIFYVMVGYLLSKIWVFRAG